MFIPTHPPPLGSLYFGCRSPHKDYLYQAELEAAVGTGLTNLAAAFDQHPTPAGEVFAQHLLLRDWHHVWKDLYQGGGHLYVCGAADTLGAGVDEALAEIVCRGGLSPEAAREWIMQIREDGRYQQDVFS